MKRINGYTLIEFLLTIAIAAILIGMGLNTYQQQATNVKVQKASQQIQMLLQAASSYYTDNQAWPNDCAPNDPFTQEYVPVGNSLNPWGKPYICQQSGGGNKFQVQSGAISDKNLQSQLAAMLPSGVIDTNSNQVIAETAIPNQPLPNIIFQDINYTNNMNNGSAPFQTNFLCPIGYLGYVVGGITHIHADDKSSIYIAGSQVIYQVSTQITLQSIRHISSGTVYYFSIWPNATYLDGQGKNQNLGNITYAYIGFCQRLGT